MHLTSLAATAVYSHGAIQKPGELEEFVALVRGVAPKLIVEIGSYAGGTLAVWTKLAETVIAVDLPPTGIYAATGMGKQSHGAEIVFGDSHNPDTVDQLRRVLAGRPVDVLFIDGDHTYQGVKSDWEMYAPLVRPGGLVAFHDIVEHAAQPDIQVHRLWGEIRTPDAIELIVPTEPPWGGIGVLHATGS